MRVFLHAVRLCVIATATRLTSYVVSLARIRAARLGAVLFFAISPALAQAPLFVSAESARYQVTVYYASRAKSACLSPDDKASLLNAGNNLLTLLRNEKDQSLARQLYDELQEIRSKPPCDAVVVPYTGGYAIKDTTRSHIEERLGADGHLTNQFDVVKDPPGGGLDFGVYFPLTSTIRVGPYASIGFLNLPAYHTFPNGNYLGATTHWMSQFGGKAGVMITPDWFVYGLAAFSLINEEVKINLGGPVTSQKKTVPGVAFGGGVEYSQAAWRLFGLQFGVFAEYSHTWSDTAHVNAPAASPAFNYSFRREDDTVKAGLHVYLR